MIGSAESGGGKQKSEGKKQGKAGKCQNGNNVEMR